MSENSLFTLFEAKFNNIFTYYKSNRKRAEVLALNTIVQIPSEKETWDEMYDSICNFILIFVEKFLPNIDIPQKEGKYYNKKYMEKFLINIKIEEDIEKINIVIKELFDVLTNVLLDLFLPIFDSFDSQNRLLQSILTVIEKRNAENSKKLEEDMFKQTVELIQLENKALQDINNETFLILAKHVKNDLEARNLKANKPLFLVEMAKYLSGKPHKSPSTLLNQIKRRFPNKYRDFEEFLTNL